MRSTMQDAELGVSVLLQHGALVHPTAPVHHYVGGSSETTTFADVAAEAGRLAGALLSLGVGTDDLVATLCWNTPQHLAAYFAVPSMGAVLHTLNLRLSDEQLVYIVNHAQDRVVVVDADLVPQLARVLPHCPSVQDVIVVGSASLDFPRVHEWKSLVGQAVPVTEWPVVDERSAAVLCYTTGTTGDPKGVAYSHRSIHLHTLVVSTGSAFCFTDADVVMPIVPMFHANAWGWPYAAWINGSALVMTGRFLQPEHLVRMIAEHGVTASAAVPTLWSGLDAYAAEHGADISSLRLAVAGGSAPSASLVRNLRDRHGVTLTQGWGMTETSPLATFSRPPAGVTGEEAIGFQTWAGRLVPGVRARVVDEDGVALPNDGTTAGEVELRGPTITGSYFRAPDDVVAEKVRDGWLRTGDLGVIHPSGWVELKDRIKDGIKSGGEWISSIELENLLAGHPAIEEVAVIGVPDPKWEERPLVCVKLRAGSSATPSELNAFLAPQVARWWLPERWTFVDDIPKTSVGKLDKKVLRAAYASDAFVVEGFTPA